MTNDQAINFIHSYCSKTIPKPKVGWPHYYLQEVAYSSCAAGEIIKRLESSTDDPVQTIKQFKEEMYEFYSMNDGARSVVFSYAYEMAEEIYILLLRKELSLKRSTK